MEAQQGMTEQETSLREDLNQEYYALLKTVAEADGRLMTVKSWSVTLSLAALSFGFQSQHFALFGLGAATAGSFWFLDALIKGHQLRYYSRMRDIEVAAYELNTLSLGALGRQSSPRIDMMWGFPGKKGAPDWRSDRPERRTAKQMRRLIAMRFILPNVMLPHVLAVLLGTVVFIAATQEWWGLTSWQP